MKHSKLFICLLVLVLTFSFISCSNDVKTQASNSSTSSKALFEMEKLTSEDELNALVTRGDDDVIDWQLSKEFAQLWLESGIEAGDYPVDSELWEIPIAVYSSDGEIQYYEFRVTSKGEVVAAITGAARKEFGCPIIYEFLTDGYADEITKLYTEGKLSTDELPRIIDNDYPNVAIGVVAETKGVDYGFASFLDSETGNVISSDSLYVQKTYEQILNENPELIDSYVDHSKIQAIIDDYNSQAKEFWKIATANKGHIADFAVRGGTKNKERTELSSGRITAYKNYVNNKRSTVANWGYITHGSSTYMLDNATGDLDKIVNYKACGAVASGFILDYLHANNLGSKTSWDTMNFAQRFNVLYDKLNITWESSSVMAWDLKDPIRAYSSYEPSYTLLRYPKESINNDLPGYGCRWGHCFPIVGYKLSGWFVFVWPQFKVWDRYDCNESEQKGTGYWQTFIPAYHGFIYNIVNK